MPAAVVQRQALVHADGSLFGYAVHARVDDSGPMLTPAAEDRLINEAYETVDLSNVVGDNAVLLRATGAMLRGEAIIPDAPRSLVIEIPASWVHQEYAEEALISMRELGFGVALSSFTGTLAERALLPLIDMAKIDLRRTTEHLEARVAQLKEAGCWVVALHADTQELAKLARDLEIELVQAPLIREMAKGSGRSVTAGEAVHLQLMRLLSQELPEHAEVVRTVGMDPELSMRVLRTVNATATGLRHHIDSLSHAVSLLGPHRLSALVSSVILNSEPATVDILWTVLTRALVTWRLSGSDIGYTVGMLSGVTSALELSVDSVVERSGVSAEVAAALRGEESPYTPALQAALGHEADDDEAIEAAGFDPLVVARVFFDAMPEALSSATRMAAPLAAA